MTTWVDNQFPRPDLHRLAMQHYGLHHSFLIQSALTGSTDAFLANIGLSDFGVRQTGEGTEQTTTVSLGKQLSRRWYVGYERSLNATAGTWQLIYRIAQRFTLRAQSGEDSSLDVIWTWRWN